MCDHCRLQVVDTCRLSEAADFRGHRGPYTAVAQHRHHAEFEDLEGQICAARPDEIGTQDGVEYPQCLDSGTRMPTNRMCMRAKPSEQLFGVRNKLGSAVAVFEVRAPGRIRSGNPFAVVECSVREDPPASSRTAGARVSSMPHRPSVCAASSVVSPSW